MSAAVVQVGASSNVFVKYSLLLSVLANFEDVVSTQSFGGIELSQTFVRAGVPKYQNLELGLSKSSVYHLDQQSNLWEGPYQYEHISIRSCTVGEVNGCPGIIGESRISFAGGRMSPVGVTVWQLANSFAPRSFGSIASVCPSDVYVRKLQFLMNFCIEGHLSGYATYAVINLFLNRGRNNQKILLVRDDQLEQYFKTQDDALGNYETPSVVRGKICSAFGDLPSRKLVIAGECDSCLRMAKIIIPDHYLISGLAPLS